jgi:rare lipoprotein A
MNALTSLAKVIVFVSGMFGLNACSTTNQTVSAARPDSWPIKEIQHGKASFYSTRTNRGSRTASGAKLNNEAPTAAHKTLPIGSKVRVVNLDNGMSEVVTITDRGPFVAGRVIDVTVGVARRLGFVARGVVPVRLEVLHMPSLGGGS